MADFDSILRLNTNAEQFTNVMDLQYLQHLHRQAACHRVVCIEDKVSAFLLVLGEKADQ